MNLHGRIAIVRNPTLKLVSIIVVLRTLRKIPFVGHCVLDGVVALLQDFVVPVQPADMVLVQRPLGVEGDIFVGGDVCLVAIGRAGAVLRRVPTGEIIVRAGEGVGGQGSLLIGLHGLGTHGALAIIGHKGNDRIHRPLSIQGRILSEACLILIAIRFTVAVLTCIPAGEGVAFAGKGVLWQIKTRIGLTCPGRHRSFAAVGVKVNSDVRSTAPYAIQIGNGRTRAGICRLGVGAVCVVQLGSGDGDGHRIIAIRIILIGCGFRTGCALLHIFADSVAAANVSAAIGGVDGANSRYAAVHIHLRISQVINGTVVRLARRIRHGLKLAEAPDEVVGVPHIAVIEIDILSVCNCQASALGNIDLNARQQSCILIDRHIAGLDIDGNVVGDRQYVACRVNAHARKL